MSCTHTQGGDSDQFLMEGPQQQILLHVTVFLLNWSFLCPRLVSVVKSIYLQELWLSCPGSEGRCFRQSLTACFASFRSDPKGRVLFDWDSSMCTLQGHSGPVRGVAFIHGGQQIVSASEDTTLRLWDVELGTCQAVLNADCSFSCLAVSVEPPLLCAGDLQVSDAFLTFPYFSFSNQFLLRLWDAVLAAHRFFLKAHSLFSFLAISCRQLYFMRGGLQFKDVFLSTLVSFKVLCTCLRVSCVLWI